MKNRDLILENARKNNAVFNAHKHCFTYKHVPNDFKNIKISKHKVLGLPMKEWFLRPLDGLCRLIGSLPLLPQSTKNTVKYVGNFVHTIHMETSMEIHETSIIYEPNTIHTYLGMDMRLGCRGVMTKTIEEQDQELLDVRARYPSSVLIFHPIDANQPDMLEKAMHALTVQEFDGIKVYPSEGYLPSHPELMKLWAYCEKNNIPVTSHCSSANMHHPDWKYRIYGKILENGVWLDVDRNVTLSTEAQVADTYNNPVNWIPVLEAYPNLRLDIAHFGGDAWGQYIKGTRNTWVDTIIDLVTKYKNCYTDFSYTLANIQYATAMLKLLSVNPVVASKVLYGSDFYMVLMAGIYANTVNGFMALLSEEIKDKICRSNHMAFLNLN